MRFSMVATACQRKIQSTLAGTAERASTASHTGLARAHCGYVQGRRERQRPGIAELARDGICALGCGIATAAATICTSCGTQRLAMRGSVAVLADRLAAGRAAVAADETTSEQRAPPQNCSVWSPA